MYKINNFIDNDDIVMTEEMGAFRVAEFQKDLSVDYATAQDAYFAAEMNVRRKQVICNLGTASVTTQAGAMQWTIGNVNAATGVKGVGNFLGKALKAKVTGESAIKPEYSGDGTLVLEPTYKYVLLLDVNEWNGSVVLQDGLFLACESTLELKTVMRSNLSSAIGGGKGLFNLQVVGSGALCLESTCPKEELIEIILQDESVKVDGDLVVAWSGALEFTVEKVTKSLIGAAATGEGLVNVYRGTGKLLLAPVDESEIVRGAYSDADDDFDDSDDYDDSDDFDD